MINYNLDKIKAIFFDVDGVLSAETTWLSEVGDPVRSVNIKDGYAMQLAVKKGLKLAIITGGNVENIRLRYEKLGLKDIYLGCSYKIDTYNFLKEKYNLLDAEIIFVGDDIPDYQVMKTCGCPCCPADAASEIKDISTYVSEQRGGHGCGRDIIEQVLKAQNKWLDELEAFGW